MSQSASDLDQRGFVKVTCPSCGNDDVWLKCEKCSKSDHFLLDDTGASCDCGVVYDHAVCVCGARNPVERLSFVPFDKGPMALADLEIAWGRVAALGGIVLALAVATGVLLWWWFG